MDWPIEDTAWTSHDFGNFGFQSRSTVVLQKRESDVSFRRYDLEDKNDWENWFDEAPSETTGEGGLYIILCSRAPPVFDEDAPASYISVTRDTWERITRSFHVHRGVIRSIAREVACFTSFYGKDASRTEAKINFTARMSKYYPRDLALSLTYTPSTGSTFVVVYGCDAKQMRQIEKRVRVAGDTVKYPLLLIGIFVELERERLMDVADQLLDKFTLRSEYLENESWNLSDEMNDTKTQEYLTLCLQSRNVTDNIRAVKRQILKLMNEIDEFGSYFASRKGEARSNDSKIARRFKKDGALMKKRLHDILNDYDNKIDECDMIVGNTTLAMQTVWNQIARRDSGLNTQIARENTVIASEAKREGTQMKSIALLTMVYLPFSSVAAIFSMDLFDWNAQDGNSVVSKYFWVFVTFAIGLTAITLFAWYHITCRHEKNAEKDDVGKMV
ncbi:hypothetical protein M426DRAFT_322794 [Hypoxylon sp. CI-4A]|nr:hypothetical protein M426DRAFT_322794 [Hypoxylon sp. CI-4A]